MRERMIIAIEDGTKVLSQPLWDASSKRLGDGRQPGASGSESSLKARSAPEDRSSLANGPIRLNSRASSLVGHGYTFGQKRLINCAWDVRRQ